MEVFVIAGPNGSGKSTAAQGIVPPQATFLNADDIARLEVSEILGYDTSSASFYSHKPSQADFRTKELNSCKRFLVF